MSERVKIGVLVLHEAKRLCEKAAKEGLEIVLEYNDHSCQRGCAVTVEMWADEKNVGLIQNFFKEDFKTHAYDGVDWTILEIVTCPACGKKFKPEKPECPDCGLCF
jgi:hypothetical protein